MLLTNKEDFIMPTAKKIEAKPKPKAKPKTKPALKPKAAARKKVATAAKPAAENKALAELKARLGALEAKVDNSDKIKQLEEKFSADSAELQKLKHDMSAWEHKVDRKLDLLHDTIQGMSGKVEFLMTEQQALEQAVASSPPPTPEAPEIPETPENIF
jgi:hypothetical protein